jgi:hypothetical protein
MLSLYFRCWPGFGGGANIQSLWKVDAVRPFLKIVVTITRDVMGFAFSLGDGPKVRYDLLIYVCFHVSRNSRSLTGIKCHGGNVGVVGGGPFSRMLKDTYFIFDGEKKSLRGIVRKCIFLVFDV